MRDAWKRARGKRDHRWAPDHMSDYLDGELPPRDRSRMEDHVRGCEECRGLLHGLQRMLGSLRAMAAPSGRPDPRQMAVRVRERLSQRPDGEA